MLYVGLDLSRKRLDWQALDPDGRRVEIGAVPPDADGLAQLSQRLDDAGVVAVILTIQIPLVQPSFGLNETIVVLVGVVVGGIDRLWTATLGGFAIGFATGVINGALPTDKTVFLPSAVFTLVILVLLLRPAGLFAPRGTTSVERV